MNLTALVSALVDFLWPPACAGCLAAAPTDGLCRACRGLLPRLPREERAIEPANGALAASFALCRYDEPVRSWILALKYAQDPHRARALGEVLAEELSFARTSCWPDAIVPVPLSRRRLRERGYNQAALLAAPVAAAWKVPLMDGLLRRVRHAAPQASLSGAARRRNLAGAFVAEGCAGRSVLIVDDVVTTGTTLREAAAALAAAGARRVAALTVCRADEP